MDFIVIENIYVVDKKKTPTQQTKQTNKQQLSNVIRTKLTGEHIRFTDTYSYTPPFLFLLYKECCGHIFNVFHNTEVSGYISPTVHGSFYNKLINY